jgi:diguanylate cyclase (GGDEF)-like protein
VSRVRPSPPRNKGEDSPTGLRAELERMREELIWAKCKISELEERTELDPLLDIFNRRGFERELKRAIAFLARYSGAAALVYLDLDGFKAVNDLHGHRAGDAVLKAVARELAAHVRASDVVARLGGDEFAVLLWHIGEKQAEAKARGLEQVIEETLVAYGPVQLAVGASAGIVSLRPNSDPVKILDAADRAMYARKKKRRKR